MKEVKIRGILFTPKRILGFLVFLSCISQILYTTTKIWEQRTDYGYNEYQQCLNSGRAREFWIERYLKWHSTARKERTARRLIFKACRSGIGDNLHGLIRTYAYAVLSERVLLIEWNEPELMREIMDESVADQFLFNSTKDSYLFATTPVVLTWRDPFEEILPIFYGDEKVVYFTTGAGPYIRQHVVDEYEKKCNIQIPRLDFKTSREIIQELLRPSDYLTGLRTTAQNSLEICGESNSYGKSCQNPYISLHARIGTGVGEGSIRRFKKLSTRQKEIAACIAYAIYSASQELYRNPKIVFLATDTPSFREVFREELKGYGDIFHLKFIDGNITHIVDIHENKDELFKREAFKHTFTELALLSDGAHLISLKSGFAQAAMLLGSEKSAFVLKKRHCKALDPE